MIALLALAVVTAQPGQLKTFKDWIVGCDNGRVCQAVALMPEDGLDDGATLVVRRGAEANAVPEIWVTPINDSATIVSANGKPVGILMITRSGELRIKTGDMPKMIAALTTAQRIDLVDAKGNRVGTVSAAGASAALRYIDEQQKRAGNVTALVAKGSASAAAVPKAVALPVITAPKIPKLPPAPYRPADVRKFAGDDCGTDADMFKPQAHRLDATHTLVLTPTPCDNGAYNYFSVALIVGNAGTKPIRARFDAPTGMAAPSDPEPNLVNAEWDGKNRLLTTYAKGRGIGDCGTRQSFAWDGVRFRLVEQAEMGACRGSLDYITTWRALVR